VAVSTVPAPEEGWQGASVILPTHARQKGLRRALSLLLIGYLLQLNLKYLKYYIAGHFNPHFLGFDI